MDLRLRYKRALSDVNEKLLSVRKAADKWNVSRSALQRRLSGEVAVTVTSSGRRPCLSSEEEGIFASYLLEMRERGIKFTVDEFLCDVQKFLKREKRPNPFKDDKPGNRFWKLFKQRNPEISANGVGKQERKQAKDIDDLGQRYHYALLDMGENSLSLRKAAKKWNVNKTSLQRRIRGEVSVLSTGQGRKPCLSEEEEEMLAGHLIEIHNRGLTFTVDGCLCAVQKFLKQKERPNSFKDDKPGVKFWTLFKKRNPRLRLINRVRTKTGSNKPTLTTQEELDGWMYGKLKVKKVPKYFSTFGRKSPVKRKIQIGVGQKRPRLQLETRGKTKRSVENSESIPKSRRKTMKDEARCRVCDKSEEEDDEDGVLWILCETCDWWMHIQCVPFGYDLTSLQDRRKKFLCHLCNLAEVAE